MVGQDVSVQAGYSYNWIDDAVDSGASYWIEDVDLNGNSTWHGPFGISSSSTGPITRAKSTLLSNLTAASVDRLTPSCSVNIRPGSVPIKQHMAQRFRRQMAGTPIKASAVPASLQKQWQIASQSAIKIAINKTGWYRVNALDLIAAGLNANTSPSSLADVRRWRRSADQGKFGEWNISGLGRLDRILWRRAGYSNVRYTDLLACFGTGNRKADQCPTVSGFQAAATVSSSFPYTVERKERSLYFSSLRNGDKRIGSASVVATSPLSESINIRNHDANAIGQAQLEVALQGVTTNTHQVTVSLNGQALHMMNI